MSEADEITDDERSWRAHVAELQDFEARFSAEDFAEVATALKVSPTPENLARLNRWLQPPLYTFYAKISGVERPVAERIARLQRVGDLAAGLLAAIDAASADLPISLFTPPDEHRSGSTVTEEFMATLRRLAEVSSARVRKLDAIRPGRGRPAKVAFLELAADLVPVYERLSGRRAARPYWISGYGYGGVFCRFVSAICRCLWDRIPDARSQLPATARALPEELRDHWAEIVGNRGEKSPE